MRKQLKVQRKNEDEFQAEKERSNLMKTIGALYSYLDEEGDLLYQAVRFIPKGFAFRQPAERGGWVWNLNGVRKVLYRLPEVIAAQEVFVVEGEKDVNALVKWGLVATCNPGGAGKWKKEYSEILAGKKVVIIPDDDEPGQKHAQDVAESVMTYAKEVRLISRLSK